MEMPARIITASWVVKSRMSFWVGPDPTLSLRRFSTSPFAFLLVLLAGDQGEDVLPLVAQDGRGGDRVVGGQHSGLHLPVA
jgi:hypothetical protein